MPLEDCRIFGSTGAEMRIAIVILKASTLVR